MPRSNTRRTASQLARLTRALARTRQELAESQKRYRSLVETMNEGIVVIDRRMRMIYVNGKFCRMVGYSRRKILGRSGTILLDRVNRAIARKQLRMRSRGIHKSYELAFIRKDGQHRHALVSPSLILGSDGRFGGSLSVVTDITPIKRTEERLAESERRFRLLLEKMNEGLVLVNEHGRITFVNDRFRQMLGYSRRSMIGKRNTDFHNPADRSRVREQFAQRRKGRQTPYEVMFRRKDGGRMLGLISPSPVFDATGQFRGSFSVVMDVTARQQAEDAIRQNELLFKRLFAANVIGVIVGQDGLITQTNDRFLRMVGYTRRDLAAGKLNWQKMTPRQYATLDRSKIREVLQTGTVSPHEKEYVRKDGNRVPVEVGGALLSTSPFRWICFVADLTQHKKAEAALQKAHDKLEQRVGERTSELARANRDLSQEIQYRAKAEVALRDSEAKYRTLVESTREAICTIDRRGVYLFMNRTGAQRLGGHPDDFIGKKLRDVFPREIADSQAALARQVIRTETGMDVDSVTELQGQRRWYRTTLEPIRDSRGKVTAALVIARDQTERKAAEEALNKARLRLVNAREEERRRLSRELHDSVAQGLVAASLKLKSVAGDLAVSADEASLKALSDLSQQHQRLSEEVREVSRNLYPSTLESFGLYAAIRQLAKDWESKDVRVTVNWPESLKKTHLSKEIEIALYRIAQEAVANAFRHAKPGQVVLELSRSKGHWRLTVTDDGEGFDPGAVRDNGLGMTSMKERAEAIGADFVVNSRPGRTRVEVLVPTGGAEALRHPSTS